MIVSGYVRVSTQEQADSGVSLAAQKEKVELYCRLHNLELACIYEDAGTSAKNMNRPGLLQLLSALERKQIQGVVIVKLDRLSRSIADFNTLINRYFKERFVLHSVTDAINTETAAGRLVLNVMMSVAQWEREAIGERTSEALRHKQNKGEYIGGNIPFGYDILPDGKLVTNATEQEVITIIISMKNNGFSFNRIAKELNGQGKTTKHGRQWYAQTVSNVVSSKPTTA